MRTRRCLPLLAHKNEQYEQQIKQKQESQEQQQQGSEEHQEQQEQRNESKKINKNNIIILEEHQELEEQKRISRKRAKLINEKTNIKNYIVFLNIRNNNKKQPDCHLPL